MTDEITSFELYLSGSNSVTQTNVVRETCAGHAPVYFMRERDKLLIATSVAALISHTGVFEPNPSFEAPDFLARYFEQKSIAYRLAGRIRRKLKIRRPKAPDPFYATYETIDRRIHKLRAFECVSTEGSKIEFNCDFTLADESAIVERSALHITKLVNKIEERFPDYRHIIFTGGKDSQLIILTPKLFPENWAIFSAEPNYEDVLTWLEKNAITIKRIYRHDNQNEETPEETELKIVASDLYSDPMHLRWLPKLKQIASDVDNKCIFWGGTISSRSHFYAGQHVKDWGEDKMTFFRNHFERAAHWQGNSHQVVKNFTGRPLISPYYSEDIWRGLYRHIDPEIYLKRRVDLRDPLGEALAGRPVWWLPDNKGPEPYRYQKYINARKIYSRYIRKALRNSRERRGVSADGVLQGIG